MQCSKCPRDAIVFQPYSGLHLCGQHLIADVEAKSKKIIRAEGWLRPGDHIAVLLTRDPRSSALLFFFKKLTAQRRDIRITAIAIADGKGSIISHAKRIAEEMDTELLEVADSEESKIKPGIDTEKNPERSPLPSFLPSRSIPVNTIALRHGITKIAWGLCLDEVAGMVLERIIRGDADKLVRSSAGQDTLTRICPFIAVPAAEVSLYSALCGFNHEQEINPEQGDGLHKDTVSMLDDYTTNHPATKYALLNLGEKIADFPRGIAGLINSCEQSRGFKQQCCDNGS